MKVKIRHHKRSRRQARKQIQQEIDQQIADWLEEEKQLMAMLDYL